MGRGLKYNIGDKVNEWEILSYSGSGYYECRCSCGVIRKIRGDALSSGSSKSCGHIVEQQRGSWVGKQFGSWTVLEYLGNGLLLCKCSCGVIKEQYRSLLTRGLTKSCGHSEIIGVRFGKLIVKERVDNTGQINTASKHRCICDCGNEIEVFTSNLSSGYVRSCGCDNKCSKYEYELSELFSGGIRNRHIIKSNVGRDLEIDIYYPNKSIGIEFNGDYWHSDYNKSKYYHWEKTRLAAEQGIHLINIFEYEWINNKLKIVKFLNRLISDDIEVIGARECIISDVSGKEAKAFEEDNHLQGSINSRERVGLYFKNKLVALMSFGSSRYDKEYDVELLRFVMGDYKIHGGAKRMLDYYINKYKPKSIVTYCDRSKFNGEVYNKLNFEFKGHTEPNYKWVKHETVDGKKSVSVLSREMCQKYKLIKMGYGNLGNTEEEIMRALKYHRIYDCGNDKYGMVVWG